MGKLGRWLQVGANIGILSGLVLVGIQLKQTNDLQKIEHISRSYELDMAHVLSAAGEDPAAILAKAVFNPEQMTPRDRIAYSASLQYMRTLAHRSAWLEGEGLFDEDWRISETDWKTQIDENANYVLKHEYGLAWWAEVRRPGTTFPDKFLDYIDQKLADPVMVGPDTFYQRVQSRIQASRQD